MKDKNSDSFLKSLPAHTRSELEKCSRQYRPDSTAEPDAQDEFMSACSAYDCTGLIPRGSNESADEFEAYKQLYPFSDPPYPHKKK